jgi:hypothetical protein
MQNKLIRTVLLSDLEVGSREQIVGIDIAIVGLLEGSLKQYATTGFSITPYQKYFLFPGTSVPRVKLQNLSIDSGIKTVRDVNLADVCFYSDSTLHKLSHTEYQYAMPKAQLELAVEEAKHNGTDDYILNRIAMALSLVESDVVACDWNSRNFLARGSQGLKKLFDDSNISSSHIRDRYHMVESENCDLVDKILNGSVKLVHEKELLANLNGDDALVITKTEFDQINSMFRSSDQDNHVLAMEIMANCNYQESMYYLLRTFKDFHSQMSNQRAKNHVNFKSLVSFLGIGKASYNWSLSAMQIVNLLKDKSLLTLELVDKVIQDYTQEIKNFSSTKENPIIIKSFTLSEELLAYFNTNYTNSIVQDFVPVVIESVAEEAVEELTSPSKDQDFIWS